MEKYTTKSAVLFIIFNKIEETKRVFEAIKNSQPPRIYLASDGARTERQNEKENVEYLRNYIVSNINWKCEIKTRFSEINQGCGRGVSNAISWFFENEEMGIILEDDCLPCPNFFRFCDELLVKYKDDERISIIAGTNQFAKYREEKSNEYFFSRFTYIWGWATYRRVWKDYDFTLSFLPQLKNKTSFEELLYPLKKHQIKKMARRFVKTYKSKGEYLRTWDYQLLCLNLMKKQFCVIPKANLICNIGFGENATHTRNSNADNSNIPFGELVFPLKEPSNFEENLQFTSDYYDFIMPKRTLFVRIAAELGRFLKKMKKR
ncbi:MAG: nucleotide-diphospho-sugar transferase [Chitinivibrionia bacterium]|nr:nucleotide-diphospho-sugar transferase [Chitinivibrionia bacterium]